MGTTVSPSTASLRLRLRTTVSDRDCNVAWKSFERANQGVTLQYAPAQELDRQDRRNREHVERLDGLRLSVST